MRAFVDFNRHILAMPVYWQLWIAVLFLTNMAAVIYLPRVEAVVVLASLAVGAMLQVGLFARFGFVRLLGLGHGHWLALVAWLATRLDGIRAEGSFYYWVVAVMAVCSVSLIIDVVDVSRYARGERTPTISLDAW